MQACHSIGLTQIEGDGGSSLLQILDCDSSDTMRSMPKRPRLIENVPVSPALDRPASALEGLKFQVKSFSTFLTASTLLNVTASGFRGHTHTLPS